MPLRVFIVASLISLSLLTHVLLDETMANNGFDERPAAGSIATEFVSAERPFKKATYTMGSIMEISAYGDDEKKVNNAISKAFDEVKRLDNLMSIYKVDSELSRINREAARGPTPCDPELIYIIEQSLRYSELTNGTFDITVCPLVSVWGFFGDEGGNIVGNIPTEEGVKVVLPAISYKNIVISDKMSGVSDYAKGKMIFFKNPQTKLDLGAIGKGYAVDKVCEALKKWGVRSALVNLAGSIYAFGSPHGRDKWVIGVKDPRDASNVIKTFEIKDKGVATSGDYERFFIKDGKRYAHIIDPRTGRPVEGVLSVTIVAPTATMADALSTGVFVLGPHAGLELIDRLDEVEGVVIFEDINAVPIMKMSKGFEEMMDVNRNKTVLEGNPP